MYEKALGYVGVVFGVLAVIGSFDPFEVYGLIGGVLFFSLGMVILQLVKKVEKLEE